MGRNSPLSGRVVLLTGAGGPVATVTGRLLAQGARVALVGALADQLGDATVARSRVLALPCTPDDPRELSQVVETVVDRFGRLDHLVNIISTPSLSSPLMELDPSALRDVVQRDLAMPLAWIQRAYWHWMAAHGGSVVNLAADVVRDGPQDSGLAGLIQLTDWLAAELAPQVDVHTIVPSPTLDTSTYQEGVAEGLSDLLAGRNHPAIGPVLVLTEERVRRPHAA